MSFPIWYAPNYAGLSVLKHMPNEHEGSVTMQTVSPRIAGVNTVSVRTSRNAILAMPHCQQIIVAVKEAKETSVRPNALSYQRKYQFYFCLTAANYKTKRVHQNYSQPLRFFTKQIVKTV